MGGGGGGGGIPFVSDVIEFASDVVGDVVEAAGDIVDNIVTAATENPLLVIAAIAAPELLAEFAFESGGAALWAEELGGAAILTGETAAQAGGFLQTLMDVGVPWNVVQALPAAGVAGLTSAVTAAIQGKDPLEALFTGGAFSLLGGSVASALIESGVSPSIATLGAQAVSQLARNGEIDPASLLTSAALGQTNPIISSALQDAGVPSWMLPTAMNAVNQAILTGDVNPQALALAATGRFVGDAVRNADWGSQNILVPTNAVRPTEAPPKTSEDTSGGLPTTNTADAQGALPTESPTQVASGPTMTDVPVREKNWGEPGYIYPDGTVEGEVKSGLNAVTTTPIPEPEVVPGTPLAPETTQPPVTPPSGGLPTTSTEPNWIYDETGMRTNFARDENNGIYRPNPINPESGQAYDTVLPGQGYFPGVTEPIGALPSTPVVDEGYDPLPNFISPEVTPAPVTPVVAPTDPMGGGFAPPIPGYNEQPSDPMGEAYPETPPSDPYGGDPNAVILIPTGDGNFVYMSPSGSGDVSGSPTSLVDTPYFSSTPSLDSLGGNSGSSSGGGGGGGGLPRVTAAPAASAPYSFPMVGGLPTDPMAAKNAMDKTTGSTDTSGTDPSRRAYLSPVVLSTQGGGKGTPTYAQLIPQLASLLSQRGYAAGGQVDADPSHRAYLAPVVANTQATGRARPTYSQLIPQVANILDQRGYADGGQVDDYFAQILAQRGYPVEMVPGPEDRMYRRHMKRGFAVNGPGTGQSDDIPTMLADGEYVIDADTVAQLGDGSSKAGAQVLDRFREEIRKHKRSAPVDKIPPKAKSPLEYMKAAQKGKKNG